MTTNKHTPGPWDYFATPQDHSMPFRIADLETAKRTIGWAYVSRDARLMAAAPDLLEALESLLDAIRQNIDGNPPTADQIFAMAGHSAVAAIARAKGE